MKAQDLPAHLHALKIAAGAAFITEILTLLRQESMMFAAFLAAVKLALLAIIVYFVLKVHLKPERWQQTITALFGAQFIVNILTIPFMDDLLELKQYQEVTVGSPPQLTITLGLIFVAIVQLWYLVLMMRIFREAMEISTVRATLNTFLVLYLITIALGALIGGFGSVTALLAN